MRGACFGWISGFIAAAMLLSECPCQCSSDLTVSAEAYVLMEADSGRVLLAHNELAEKPIASTTKIMTALVALEHSSLTDTVTVKPEHLLEGSSMYLRDGETLTMEALLYGLMLPSGNDAAACIADNCGHGSENFVRWMNEKAASLGMTHTRFANPSGLDEDGHYSCALDMARLMAFAMRQPEFARIVSAKTATAGERVMGNHNKLLGTVPGCDGGKTGYTGAAGRTLVTCAQRGGMRLVAVTLHDGSDWQDHKAMYEYGFSAYHTERAVCRGACCAICAVRGGESTFVEARAQRGFFYPVAQDEKLTLRVELNETVHSPVRAGQTLGSAVVLLDGAEVGRVPLTAANDVETAPSAEERTSLADRLRGIWHAAA